jgi:hypothetical protein
MGQIKSQSSDEVCMLTAVREQLGDVEIAQQLLSN